MLDLAVVNGDVFIEGAFRKADIGIKDGKLIQTKLNNW